MGAPTGMVPLSSFSNQYRRCLGMSGLRLYGVLPRLAGVSSPLFVTFRFLLDKSAIHKPLAGTKQQSSALPGPLPRPLLPSGSSRHGSRPSWILICPAAATVEVLLAALQAPSCAGPTAAPSGTVPGYGRCRRELCYQ